MLLKVRWLVRVLSRDEVIVTVSRLGPERVLVLKIAIAVDIRPVRGLKAHIHGPMSSTVQ